MTSTNNIILSTKVPKPEDLSLADLSHLSEHSFPIWCLTSGAKADSNYIDFNDHRYLLPIYACDDTEIAIIKAAQVGLSVWIMLKLIWWLSTHNGRKAGYYWPTEQSSQLLSKDRLAPLLASIPSISHLLDSNDKLSLRKIGDSSLYIFHLGGVASKDSVPLDFLAFDETRLMSPAEVDRTLERISHSPYKLKHFLSTAGLSNTDIHARFLDGTQHIWKSKCMCPDGVDLAKTFPDCVVDDKKRGKLYLRCPKCKAIIRDPQNGRYVPHNSGAGFTSFSVSQLASKFISLKEIWDMFHRTTNKAEFYNAKLGLPYIDEENRGVTREQLNACIDKSLEWRKPKESPPTAMGVDVGGGYCYVVIADLVDSKKRIRHVEIIESDNTHYMEMGRRVTPFKRLRQLMKDYNVQLCVVDAMPNYDMVMEFCQDFPGKVFASFYTEAKDLVSWSDRPKVKVTQRKAGPYLKFKYNCLVSRYLAIDVSLGEWAKANVICPDPDRLVQWALDEKTRILQEEAVMNRAFDMFQRLIKRFEVTNEETGEGRNQWIYSNKDPHFAHAWVYCNLALERMRRNINFTFA